MSNGQATETVSLKEGTMQESKEGVRRRRRRFRCTEIRIKKLAELTGGEAFYGSNIKPDQMDYDKDKQGNLQQFFHDRVKDGTLVNIRRNYFGWRIKPRLKAAASPQKDQSVKPESRSTAPLAPSKNEDGDGKTAKQMVELMRQEIDVLIEAMEQAIDKDNYNRVARLATLLSQLTS